MVSSMGVAILGFASAAFSVAMQLDNVWLLSYFQNPSALLSMAIAVGCLLYYMYLIALSTQGSDLIKAEKSVYVDSSGIVVKGSSINNKSLVEAIEITGSKKTSANKRASSNSPILALDASLQLKTPFELYVNAIVKALDDRISLSEIKANLLLSQGKSLMGWGVAFYICAIGMWQVLAHYWGYNYILLVGMVSSSLLFVVIEFLAAWFLKQYRSYIDSSMAYLQIRSVYNNYLLTYYSLDQFNEQVDMQKLLVDMLAKEITWPSISDLSKNDFNYMLESLSAFSGTIDKVKKTLDATSEKNDSEKKGSTKPEAA